MIEFVQSRLLEIGCQRIGINCPDVVLYYKTQFDTCSVISIIDYRNAGESELNTTMLVSVKQAVKDFLESKGFASVDILMLVVTYSEYLAQDLIDERMSYWVLDSYHNTFIVPQGQPETFCGFENVFLQMFGQIHGDTNGQSGMGTGVPLKKPFKLFTINNLLVLVNVVIYVVLELQGSTRNAYFMLEHGAFFWPAIKIHGEIYRFFTCMFIHFGFSHLINNMIILFFLGDNLERAVGKVKYVVIYLGTGLAATLVSCIYYLIIDEYVLSGGASGAIFGVIGALVYIVFFNKGKLEDLSSRKLVFFIIFSFYSGFTSTDVDNAAHIGGFLAGLILGKILYRKPEQTIQY